MGALAPGSAHTRPSAQAPIDTNGNLWAHMSWRGGQKKILAISGNSKHFSFFPEKKPYKIDPKYFVT